MIIVIRLTTSENGEKEISSRTQILRIALLSYVMRQAVLLITIGVSAIPTMSKGRTNDKECEMPNEDSRHDTTPYETTHRVTVRRTDQSRQSDSQEEREGDVMLVLKSNDCSSERVRIPRSTRQSARDVPGSISRSFLSMRAIRG